MYKTQPLSTSSIILAYYFLSAISFHRRTYCSRRIDTYFIHLILFVSMNLEENSSTFDSGLLSHDSRSDLKAHHVQAAGIPQSKPLMTWLDVGVVVLCLSCLTIAISTVWSRTIACSLGQTYQLIVIGFLLSIMAICTQRQLRQVSLLYEVYLGHTSIKNIDALLKNNSWSPEMGLRPRLSLLLMVILPLALSASYKTFSGGESSLQITSDPSFFGLVDAPGYQKLGVAGFSHLAKAYTPYWIDPGFNRTYGFNLFVESSTTAALLDAPLPNAVREIQANLRPGDFVLLTADVNGTVSENVPLDPAIQSNATWWNQTYQEYGSTGPEDRVYVWGDTYTAMLAGSSSDLNNSQIFLSWWNAANGTFEASAQRFISTRRLCTGTWNITQDEISLRTATILQDGGEAIVTQDQSLIQENQILLATFFRSVLAEYNYRFKPSVPVHTLTACMLWSRLVCNIERIVQDSTTTVDEQDYNSAFFKSAELITTIRHSITLIRSSSLLAVLIVQPTLTLLATLGKILLYKTPIGDGFGVVTLLAGLGGGKEENQLKGASLSGKLERDIMIQFEVTRDDAAKFEYVSLNFGGNRGKRWLTRQKKYG